MNSNFNRNKNPGNYSQKPQPAGNDKISSLFPVPDNQKKLLGNPNCNFSLYSPRMIVWEKNKKGEFKFDSESMARLEEKSRSCFQNTYKLLKERKGKINEED